MGKTRRQKVEKAEVEAKECVVGSSSGPWRWSEHGEATRPGEREEERRGGRSDGVTGRGSGGAKTVAPRERRAKSRGKE